MKIECILKRVGGTIVELGKEAYSFLEQKDGAHVAEVTDKDHIQRLLGIPEAYRIYDPSGSNDNNGNTPATALLGSSVHPDSFEIGDKTYTLGDVVGRAFKDSGMAADEWNKLADETRADLIDEALDKIAAADGSSIDEDEEITQLRAQYQAKFGKPAHHAMKAETLRAKLAE